MDLMSCMLLPEMILIIQNKGFLYIASFCLAIFK